MVISSGNYSRRTLALTEDTTVSGGNFSFCNIVDNGFQLDRQGGNWNGWKLNGVKQDSFTIEVREQLPAYAAFIDTLGTRGGKDALDAWVVLVDIIQANPADMPAATCKSLYDAALGDNNTTYMAGMIKAMGYTYTQVRNFVNSHSRDQLIGEKTELVEVIS